MIIYEYPDGLRVVYVETDTADLYLSAADDVTRYEGLLDRLEGLALDESSSLRLLGEMG
jgi:hypothetical protein